MKYYRVGIFASVNVTAENEEEAIDRVRHILASGWLPLREYDFDVQDRELDPDEDFVATMLELDEGGVS